MPEVARAAIEARKRYDAAKRAEKSPERVAIKALLASGALALRPVAIKLRASAGRIEVEDRRTWARTTDPETGKSCVVQTGTAKFLSRRFTLKIKRAEGVAASFGNVTGAGETVDIAARECARITGAGDVVKGAEAIMRAAKAVAR